MTTPFRRSAPPRWLRAARGFTLVELLVAMSVLTGITLLITILVSNVTKTVELGKRSIDSDAIARSFFNRLSRDIDNMLIRKDINYGFHKQNAKQDDLLSFLTTSKGTGGSTRPISVISYERFNREMQRCSRSAIVGTGTSWNAPIFVSGAPALDLDDAALLVNDSAFTIANSDYQSFGGEIIRFEYSFLLEDSTAGVVLDSAPPASIPEIKGVSVAIAVLDPNIYNTLSGTEIDSLSSLLVDSDTLSSADIGSTWGQALAGTSGALAKAAANVRVYQRVYLFQQ